MAKLSQAAFTREAPSPTSDTERFPAFLLLLPKRILRYHLPRTSRSASRRGNVFWIGDGARPALPRRLAVQFGLWTAAIPLNVDCLCWPIARHAVEGVAMVADDRFEAFWQMIDFVSGAFGF